MGGTGAGVGGGLQCRSKRGKKKGERIYLINQKVQEENCTCSHVGTFKLVSRLAHGVFGWTSRLDTHVKNYRGSLPLNA